MRSSLQIYSLIGTALLFLGSSTRAAAVTIADGDVAGLKSAIATSNANGQDDTIDLATNGTYVLTVRDNALNGLPAVAPDGGHKLTINGHGATIMRSSVGGTPTFRILYVNSGANLTLDGLILTNGFPGAFHGGAIYNDGETGNVSLTIKNCTITGNTGDYGGAIFNDGYQDPSFPAHTATLTVSNSTVSGNTGTQHGGGIWNESGGIVMNVSYCAFNQNTAAGQAGAIQVDGSAGTITASITNSTFSQNSAGTDGGAVNVDGDGGFDFFGNPVSGSATLTITNCTFDQNSAHRTSPTSSGFGGAIAMDGSNSGGGSGNALVKVGNCTLNGNSAQVSGGGIYVSQNGAGTTSLQIGNTILKSGTGVNLAINNTSGGTASITSLGHNLCNDGAGGDATTGPGGFLNHVGDMRNTDALLDPAGLQNNGGPTQTIGLQLSSTAVNQGDDSIAPERDQRGYVRSGASDIGAFDLGGTLAPINNGSTKPHGAAGAFSINFPLTGPVGIECRSGGATGDHQLVMTFASPVTVNGNPQAQVTSGTGQIGTGGSSNGGVVTVNGSTVTVPLTNVANAQRLTATIFAVNDGVHTANVSIPMGVLAGDTTANGLVNSSDIAQTQSQSGQALNASNFREDVTVSGEINSSDISFVQSRSGTGLPAAAAQINRNLREKSGRLRANHNN